VVHQRESMAGGIGGQIYTLSEEVYKTIKEYRLFCDIPKNDPFFKKKVMRIAR